MKEFHEINGNFWSVEIYTYEEALEAATTLVDCTECVGADGLWGAKEYRDSNPLEALRGSKYNALIKASETAQVFVKDPR